jgi:hypothetical protein
MGHALKGRLNVNVYFTTEEIKYILFPQESVSPFF